MFAACKQYLIGKLREAGIRSNPYTTDKALEKSQESHLGAVLFNSEDFLRNGSKTIFKINGATRKRRKVFDRGLSFDVLIGDYTEDAVEAIFERFLAGLDKGLYVDGNYVTISVDAADWVDKDDSFLKAKVAVVAKVHFEGGIYRDTNFAKLSKVEVVSTEKGKEPSHGS